MMHHKFAIKDNKYVCSGSLNWVDSSISNNCEDTVYMTNSEAVEKFQEAFEELWEYLEESRQNYYVKSVIKSGFFV